MKRKVILACILACLGLSAQAQGNNTEEPKGNAIIQVFGSLNTGFGADNDVRGFELDRSYLGYEYNLGNGLSIKSVIDMGKSSDVTDNNRLAYVKNAMITWKKDKMILNGGLIGNVQFNYQEKFWGYRYILASFQDVYKFGSSADLGLSLTYKFNDAISADAIIVNGEGYKKLQKKDGLCYGVGVTVTPVKGFHLRLYGSINEASEDNEKDKINLSTFAGYKNEKFSIGAEYNFMKNSSNIEDTDMNGYSIYTTIKLSGNAELYARFDDLSSKDDWNIFKDEQAAIAGVQFKLGKYVKLAPNFRIGFPKVDGAENSYAAYVNFYFGL